jgi:hypothetical protein
MVLGFVRFRDMEITDPKFNEVFKVVDRLNEFYLIKVLFCKILLILK